MLMRTVRCGLCGTRFECAGLSLLDRCWCSEVKIPEEALEKLSTEASDCVCPACLNAAARTGKSWKQ